MLPRAQARQTLIDTWASRDWDLARDPQLLNTFGACVIDWPNMSNEDKSAFDLGMGTYLANLANGLMQVEAGLLDKVVLDRVADRMVLCVTAPGGAVWWKETNGVWPQVRANIDQRIASGEATIESADRSMRYFTGMTKN